MRSLILLTALLFHGGVHAAMPLPQLDAAMETLLDRADQGDTSARRQLAARFHARAVTLFQQYADTQELASLKQAALHAAWACDLDPDSAAHWAMLGQIYLQQSDRNALENADYALSNAYRLAPDDRFITLLLGETHLLQRRVYSARDYLLPLLIDADQALAARLIPQLVSTYVLNGDVAQGVNQVFAYFSEYPQNIPLATVYTILLATEQRVAPNSQLEARLQQMNGWWRRQQQAPVALKEYMRQTYLEPQS